MINTPAPSEHEVLLSFAAEPDRGPATLEDYARRYPEHAEALASLAVELLLAPKRKETTCATDDAAVDRAWSAFVANATPLESKSLGTTGSLLAALAPGQFRALAGRIGANTLLLAQLRDRLIDVSTIPRHIIAMLARELATSLEAVIADLAKPPVMAASERFKSDHKPGVGTKIPFEAALQGSGLDEAQQAKLRNPMD